MSLQKKSGEEQDAVVTEYGQKHQGDVWRILKKMTFGDRGSGAL